MKRGVNRKTILTALAMSALYAPVYAAPGMEENAAESAQMSEEVLTLEPITVTASRTEMQVRYSPAATEVITSKDIEKMGAENLAQALQLAIGINILENGMVGNQISIRGMNTNQTLLLVDGRRIRSEDGSSTQNYYELQRFNIDEVDRIEIVRGGVSSMYGSEAIGGVINIITKKPEKMQTSLRADWTSRQSNVGFRQDFGKQGKWGWSLAAKKSDYRDIWKDDSTLQYYGEKYYVNLDGRYDIDDKRHLDIYMDYMKEDFNTRAAATNGTVSRTNYDNWRISTGVKYAGKDRHGDYELQYYYNYLDKVQPVYTHATGAKTGEDRMKYTTHVFDGKRTVHLSDAHSLTFGGEYRGESVNSTRILGSSLRTWTPLNKPLNERSVDYTAFYLQDTWTPDGDWIVIPSVRFDQNTSFGNKVTANLGVMYSLSRASRLKLNYGTSYNAPSISQLYIDYLHSSGRRRILGNPELRPETARNFDISLETAKGGTSAKLTYFHNSIDNLIDAYSVPTMVRTTSYRNVNEASIRGVEAEVKHRFDAHFTLRGTYTYLDAKDTRTNIRLEDRARHRGSLQLLYTNDKGGINAILWNDWYGDYYGTGDDDILDNASATIFNFVVNKKIGEHATAYFGVSNLFNQWNDTLDFTGRIWRGGVNFTF